MDPLQYTAPLPGGSGQWTSCSTLPHCLGALGSGTPAIHCPTAWGQWAVELLQYTAPLPGGSGLWTSCNTLPHCLGAVGSGPPAVHCPTAWGQWAVDLLQHTASPPGGSGQWTSCNALSQRLGQWAVDLLRHTAPLPGGSGQWNSCNALPHCPGAVGSGPSAMHCPAAWGLVTWHQSKNPQDGSCRTDCLHALPRSTRIVNRRDSRATT